MSNVSPVLVDSLALAHLHKIATFTAKEHRDFDMGNVYFFTYEKYWYAFAFHPHFGAFYKLHKVQVLPEGQTEADITFRANDPVFQAWVKTAQPKIEWDEEARNWVIYAHTYSTHSVGGLFDLRALGLVNRLITCLAHKKLIPAPDCDMTVDHVSVLTPHKKAILSFWRAEGEGAGTPMFVGANMRECKYYRGLKFMGLLMGYTSDGADDRCKKVNNFFKEEEE